MSADKPNYRFVFAGGPGAGKTTVLDALSMAGYECMPDTAREIIRERRAAGLSPRPAPAEFSQAILERDIANHQSRNPAEVTFYERGVVDSVGGLIGAEALDMDAAQHLLADYAYNPAVFLFPPWADIYRTDAERDQTYTESLDVYKRTGNWYRRCGYQTLEVPIGPVPDRVTFVLTAIEEIRTETG